MQISYHIADTRDDRALAPAELNTPFLLAPQTPHPFFTLGDYFTALSDLFQPGSRNFSSVMAACLPKSPLSAAEPAAIRIRSEKHGAYYHIARLELEFAGGTRNLAATTALSEAARECLHREFELMRRLAAIPGPAYLPRVYCLHDASCNKPAGRQPLSIMLGEWLHDYHEWHLTRVDQGRLRLRVWKGDRHPLLTERQGAELCRQAAAILTHYYDPGTFRQIYPWHHAAGDFVVKLLNGGLEVKLITARGYESVADFGADGAIDPVVPFVLFFLNLMLRLRLDRLDGTGEPAWLADYAVPAAAEGFFASLTEKSGQHSGFSALVPALTTALCTFSEQDFQDLYQPVLELYRHQEPESFKLILPQLAAHCRLLHTTLRAYATSV